MFLKKLFLFFRISTVFTFFLGPVFKTKHDFLEIDITYRCDLRCVDCNRSCGKAPSDESMSVEQVRKFVSESIEKNKKWNGIRLLGGEPTMHDDLFEIIDLILGYKNFYPKVMLRFATNGASEKSREIIKKIPNDFIVENTDKGSKKSSFTPFNYAPIDSPFYGAADFSNACYITEVCGLGLTKYGFYQCAIAGSIDRVFGFNIGRSHIPCDDDEMIEEKRILCRYCGHFRELIEGRNIKKSGFISRSWLVAYRKYKDQGKQSF
jgi:hypothetical protein